MRIILIVVLMVLTQAGPIYGLRLSDDGIGKEKDRIAENIASAREKRENNLHPFVQVVPKEQGNEFNYAAEKTIPIEPEIKTQDIKTREQNTQPNGGINFLFFSLILAAFLLSYFFIRPRSK